jgi:hypothetical protein
MLSAGNLNTAALTLFRPQLQWLIVDDPAQGMDEVHIIRRPAEEFKERTAPSYHRCARAIFVRVPEFGAQPNFP